MVLILNLNYYIIYIANFQHIQKEDGVNAAGARHSARRYLA